jgi:hypothetical protein
VSRRVHPKISEEGDLRANQEGTGRRLLPVGEAEGKRDRGRSPDVGPNAHDDFEKAEIGGVAGDRLHQAEERDPRCPGLCGP